MGDLIDRQAAIDALNKLKIYRPLDSDRYVISDCLNKIVNLPSAQPEIIYCKDCVYYRWEIDMCDEPYSTAHNVLHEYDFCSKAEKENRWMI